MLKISEFAAVAQVSVRLLHYYDEIEILRPARIDRSSGYRYYSIDQLPRLNRILALRDLGLALDDIATMLAETVSADEIREILHQRKEELHAQLAQDRMRLAEAEMRLRTIEREGQMLPYDVVVKSIAPEFAITAVFGMIEGQSPIDFYTRCGAVTRAAGIRQYITSIIGIHPHAFVIDQLPRTPFPFQPAYAIAREHAREIIVPSYGALHPGELPGHPMALTTLHEGAYSSLFTAHTALLQWAETNDLRPLGPVREIYLRDATPHQPPLIEVQMPVGE